MIRALASPAFATLLLLAACLGEASRDDGSNAGALEPASREAVQSKLAAAAAHRAGNMPSRTSLAVGVKANLNSIDSRKSSKRKEDDKPPEGEDDESSEGSEESSEEGSEESSEEGSEEGSKGSKEESAKSEKTAEKPNKAGNHSLQNASDASKLCSVGEDLEPMVALRDIESCVKQLEMVKEGTLVQGRISWEETNGYVKGLAQLQGRLTELARPEPFEIAFATDQADMYNKLKTRLQSIQADLPKLEGE